MNLRTVPKITLVGAGPGDPKLLTIAGLEAIKSADVILYDALANDGLLAHNQTAEKVFVGKRKGYKAFSQEEINQLLVAYALKGNHVVRLKGGDSLIFGRGSEELDYAEKNHIETNLIPGVSSVTSVPSALRIPLTKRGVSRSFFVTTATNEHGDIPDDLTLAAKSNATVVILMGMTKLGEIVKLYKSLRKDNEPVAIIQNGYGENQKSITGTIDTIEELVRKNNMGTPALIIIGEVVNHANRTLDTSMLNSFSFA